nr:hypothetical protein [Tanacetum cinerariifolium]
MLVPKLPENYARCAKCGHLVNGPYCQGCALLREKLEDDLVTYFQNFQNTSESSDDNGIYCQQGICKSCGKGAHTGYNCPPKVPIISNPEPCNQTMNNELPQTLPSFDTTCYSDKENSVPCVSKPNFVDESSNIFNPLPQPPIFSCEFCGSNAQYGHYCIPQAPFISPEPGYNYEAFYFDDDHIKEIIRGSTTTHSDISLSEYDSFIFDLTHEEFVDELAHIISPPEYNCFYFGDLPDHEAAEIVIPEVREIKDDNLREKLFNVILLIANIEALEDNPTQSSELLTKSSSTSLNSFLEETNTFHNSLPEFENFYFDLGEISSGSTTTHCDISLPDYEAFYFDDAHVKEISSESTTT